MNIDKFIDLYFGDNLYTYQKLLIKAMCKCEDIKLNFRRPKVDTIPFMKALKLDFYVATPQGLEECKHGELVSIKPYDNQNKYMKSIIDEVELDANRYTYFKR